jgi:hypothetical protein
MRRTIASDIFLLIFGIFLSSIPARELAAQQNTPPPQNPSDENPPGRAARISYLKGKVFFQPSGTDEWSEAALNFTVTTGDRIYTEKNSRAELEIGPYTVRLWENTDVTITSLND